MLMAKEELQNYAGTVGGKLDEMVSATLARLISRITAEEAEAVLLLLKEAEAVRPHGDDG
jgi:hypothetical protein